MVDTDVLFKAWNFPFCYNGMILCHGEHHHHTLPEELARWLRIKAAENERCVSKWIAELQEGMRRQENEYGVAMKRYRVMKPRKIDWPDGRRPGREELYDRPGLRWLGSLISAVRQQELKRWLRISTMFTR